MKAVPHLAWVLCLDMRKPAISFSTCKGEGSGSFSLEKWHHLGI